MALVFSYLDWFEKHQMDCIPATDKSVTAI